MSFNKKFFTTGGIVASAPPAAAGLDPLQNFETVTYTGNGSTQKITGYIRKGAAFNGSSSDIDLPNFMPSGNASRSVAMWINTTQTTAGTLFTYGGSSTDTLFRFRINDGGAGGGANTIGIGFFANDFNRPATSLMDGSWHHVVATYDGTNAKIYIDGVQTGADYATGGVNTTASTAIIGSTGAGAFFNGKIDQVRIFNTALNSTQVGQLALETYADPKKSTTDYFGDGSGVALYELDEDANSSNFGQAAVFNGSSSYISGLNGVIPATTTDCTFSCWFNMSTGFSSNFKSILGGTGVDSLRITINYSSSGNYKIQPGRGISSNAFYSSSNWSATAILPNLWYHLVCVYTNSSNTMDVYLNNNLIDSEVLSTTTSSAVNTNLVLGYYRSDVGFSYWNGSIDQVRIYSSALGTGDVEKLYKESADVPTANLVAHYKLDGNAEDVLDTYDGTTSNVTYSTGVYGGTPTNVNFLGMSFTPNFVWIKERTSTSGHFISDSVRGATKVIYSNLPNSEDTETTVLTSFDPNGFTVGSSGGVNQSSQGYVAWCWKAADTTTTISAGTVGNDDASNVRANQDAGFSIVEWSSSGGARTVAHGLNSAPELIIIKKTTTPSPWSVYVSAVGNNKRLQLNESAAAALDNIWGNTDPTNQVFTQQISASATTDNIAYCFHSVDGYQKVGSYTGDGSTSGNIITTGFKPRFLLTKPAGPTGGYWYILDSTRNPSNPRNNGLFPNDSLEEISNSNYNVDFLSNGFELKNNSIGFNTSGETYIYLAIA